VTEVELVAWCRGRIAGYKRPRSVSFIGDDEMPRTATGKIMHRVLRPAVRNRRHKRRENHFTPA
jgi:acyl-CoA synthetase (AMP-forming)/AMP-acid ligase II